MATSPLKFTRSPGLVALLIGMLACSAVLIARELGKFQWLELSVYDTFLRWRAHTAVDDPRIVLVEITQDDIENPKLSDWPLWDNDLAKLLTTLEGQQPCAIGVDLIRNLPVPKHGSDLPHLNDVLLSNRNIICIWQFGDSHRRGIAPPPILQPFPDRLGTTSFVVDDQIDKIVRRGVLFLSEGTNTFRSLSLQLARRYLNTKDIHIKAVAKNPNYFQLGKTVFRPFEKNDGAYVNADASGYQLLLDFKGPKKFPTYTLTQALTGQIPSGALHNKLVLIGVSAAAATDYFMTPIEYEHRGVEVHAQMLNQLLRAALDGDQPLRVWPNWMALIWILVWCLLGTAIGFWVRSPWKFVLLTSVCLLALAACAWWGFQMDWWILLVTPATAFLLSAILVISYVSQHEKMQHGFIMNLFSKHVSREVAETIWSQRADFLEGGRPRAQQVTATVLFTDLKGYSTLSEQMGPAAVMDWLNEYMSATTRVVIDHGGVVHKYFGDSIMAVFGAPLISTTEQGIKRDAMNAVRCALAMEETLLRLNQQWSEKGMQTGNMRVGIHTGPLMAGSLGSADRMEYAVIGDTVNTASRLESMDKDSSGQSSIIECCRILIGETTYKLLDHQFDAELVGTLPLKGKAEKVTVYRVVRESGEVKQSRL